MGLAHSPRIVTDGLVLALDAGNVKGYDSKENRILYSEDLTQWGNTSSVDTSNTQIAPNGTQTADEVYATSATVNQGLINRSSNTASTFVQNSWHTFSVHWKAGTSSGFRIQLPWNDGGNAGVFATFVESGGEVSVPTVGGYGNYESGGATVDIASMPTSNLLIGRPYSTSFGRRYNGQVAAVKVYNRALTASEIKQNFNALRGRFGI